MEESLCPLCWAEVEDQRHVLTGCNHIVMGPLRSRAWADLGAFLDLVEKGELVLDPVVETLEPARVALRNWMVLGLEGGG